MYRMSCAHASSRSIADHLLLYQRHPTPRNAVPAGLKSTCPSRLSALDTREGETVPSNKVLTNDNAHYMDEASAPIMASLPTRIRPSPRAKRSLMTT